MVNGKAIELLKYMDMTLEKEEQSQEKERYRIWMQYLSFLYAQRPTGSESFELKRAREDFVGLIKPKSKEESHGLAIVYQWDFERLKQLKAQKGG